MDTMQVAIYGYTAAGHLRVVIYGYNAGCNLRVHSLPWTTFMHAWGNASNSFMNAWPCMSKLP